MLLVELTCPAEEGIEAASIRKHSRYLQLASNINNDNTKLWQASVLTIEAGARGFVAHSMMVFLKKIGFSPRRARAICKNISLICANCSYTIFLQMLLIGMQTEVSYLFLNLDLFFILLFFFFFCPLTPPPCFLLLYSLSLLFLYNDCFLLFLVFPHLKSLVSLSSIPLSSPDLVLLQCP